MGPGSLALLWSALALLAPVSDEHRAGVLRTQPVEGRAHEPPDSGQLAWRQESPPSTGDEARTSEDPGPPALPVPAPGSGPAPNSPPDSGTSSETGTSTSTGKADDAPRKPKESGVEGIVVPLVSFNTDFGFGYGGVGGMYVYGPGYVPYRYGLALQAYWTTRGIQNHFLRIDAPDLIGRARIEVRAEYRRELLSPFFGLGNDSSPDFSGDLSEEAVNYERTFPGGWLRARYKPFGRKHTFEAWGALYYRHYQIRVLPGSALDVERPLGILGGSNGQVSLGAVWDTRDDETSGTRGGAEEISLRVSGKATLSDYTFGAVTLVERRFWSLGTPRLVLAQRLTLDWILGEAPFFELPNFGGLQGGEGIGGMSSVRGIPRNRYVGDVKVFSNTELRWNPLDFSLFKQKFTFGGLAFFDIGRTWADGVEDGPWWLWHPGAGLGLRLTRRAAVVRLDAAYDLSTWRPALYITIGQMF